MIEEQKWQGAAGPRGPRRKHPDTRTYSAGLPRSPSAAASTRRRAGCSRGLHDACPRDGRDHTRALGGGVILCGRRRRPPAS